MNKGDGNTRRGVRSLTTVGETTKKRELMTVAIRKQKREESFLKRRHLAISTPNNGAQSSIAPANMTGGGSTSTDPRAVAIASLLDLFKRCSTPEELSAALRALNNVLPEAVKSLQSGDANAQLNAMTFLRQLLSIETNPPIDAVISSGAVPLIIAALSRHEMPRLQYEAAWCLTNIASGTFEQTAILVKSGVVQQFVALLESNNEPVREQAMWGIGNICGDSVASRDFVLGQPGIIEKIHNIVRNAKNRSVIKTAAWTLLVMCRGIPAPLFKTVRSMLPMLGTMLHSADVEVVSDACSALLCVTANTTVDGDRIQRINAIVDMGITRRIAELLYSPSAVVQQLSVRLLGRITAGNDSHTQTVINVGALPALLSLLSGSNKAVKQEVCWTISNITAGNPDQVGAIIRAGFVPYLLEFMREGEFDVKREATYAVANACCSGNIEQVQKLAIDGCLEALCNLLGTHDAKMLAAVLDALDCIARSGFYGVPDQSEGDDDDDNIFLTKMDELGVISRLEALAENHTDVAVCTAAERILDRFNDDDEIDDDDDDDDIDERGTGNVGAFQSLMDAAAAEEEEESDDVITVPDMPSAGPITLPSSSAAASPWSTSSSNPSTQSPFSGFSFSSQPQQPQSQQTFFFSSSSSASSSLTSQS